VNHENHVHDVNRLHDAHANVWFRECGAYHESHGNRVKYQIPHAVC